MINILNMDYRIHDKWCKDFYSQYIKEDDKVCVLAFSFRDSQISGIEDWLSYYGEQGIYYTGIVESFMAFGINEKNIKFVNYFDQTTERIIEMISESTILYLPGGIPTGFYNKIIEKALIETIKVYEGVIIGCSAGAMIQMDEYFISPDKDYPNFSIEKGVGLLSGFGIEAHFNESKIQRKSITMYKEITDNTVYGIGNEGVLVVEDKSISIFGDVAVFDLE